MRLEPGDVVRPEGRDGDWRVVRITADETPSAVLERVVESGVHEDEGPRGGDGAVVVGAPFVRVLDLPPRIGSEEDGLPLVAVAAEPWRGMRLFAGSAAETLTARAEVETPATVGVLVEPLAHGVRYRWDEANALVVRVEGAAPEGAVEAAVLGGANVLAVEMRAGWEVVQFRTASLVAAGVWRLTGLLRGQQGTEVEMRTGATAGAVVVFLDQRLARAEIGWGERGLPLVCRAGPAGAAPGGRGFGEVGFEFQGVQARPWSPVGLGVETTAEGLVVRWTSRVRLYGDGWDGEPTPVDPVRFRLRLLDGAVVVRTDEALEARHVYAAGTVPAGARIAVSQWGEGFGWGVEAEIEAV